MRTFEQNRSIGAGEGSGPGTAGTTASTGGSPQNTGSTSGVTAAALLGDCIAALALSGHDQPQTWLPAAAECVRRFVAAVLPAGSPTGGLGVSTMLLVHAGVDGGLVCRGAATAGLGGSERAVVEHLQNAVAGEPSRQAAWLQTGCWTRRQAIADENWPGALLRAQRMSIGLDEFARGVVGVSGPEQPSVLMVELEQRSGETWPEAVALDALKLLMPLLKRVFDATVGRQALHRAAVLARVSSAQRPIVKLLADGLTEKQIASRIHRSQHTVHDHVKTIYASLGISTRHDLMELWSGRMALAERMPLPVMPGLSAARSTMIQATLGAGHTASPQAIGWLEPNVQLKAG
jgi:DNA-binding CsgD family transcriptional regulator